MSQFLTYATSTWPFKTDREMGMIKPYDTSSSYTKLALAGSLPLLGSWIRDLCRLLPSFLNGSQRAVCCSFRGPRAVSTVQIVHALPLYRLDENCRIPQKENGTNISMLPSVQARAFVAPFHPQAVRSSCRAVRVA